MYFIQHLLFPGNLVSAAEDGDSSNSANPKNSENLPDWLKEAVCTLPPSLQAVLFIIQDLPATSTPDAFSADFPVDRLPEEYGEAEKFSLALYTILQAVDPIMAARWHWRDIRKVRRSVEVALQTGKRHSEIIVEQQQVPSEAEYASRPLSCRSHLPTFINGRYRTLVFWLYAKPEVLEPRLDSRVEKMVDVRLLHTDLEGIGGYC